MESFKEFFQIPLVQFIGWGLGAIGWMVGIYSGYLQWKGYKQQQNDRAPFNYLFEQVQRDWKAKYTEEQANQLTQQFNELTQQSNQLEKHIREQIPTMARRVFLDDQKYALENSIGNLFQQYKTTVNELENIGNQTLLSSNIHKEIEEKIIPNYFKQQKQQRNTYLMIFVILTLIVLPISPVYLLYLISTPLIKFLSENELLRNYLAVVMFVSVILFAFRFDKIKEIVLENKHMFLGLCFAGIIISIGIIFSLYSAIIYTESILINLLLLAVSLIMFSISIRILGMLFFSWFSTIRKSTNHF